MPKHVATHIIELGSKTVPVVSVGHALYTEIESELGLPSDWTVEGGELRFLGQHPSIYGYKPVLKPAMPENIQ
jgi:hypothetical protein